MNKYYTRACNFITEQYQKYIKKKKPSLNGNKLISFDKIEIIHRKKLKLLISKILANFQIN